MSPPKDLKEALRDPAAGPRPITLEEYRARQRADATRQPETTLAEQTPKKRTGAEARFKRDIGETRRRLLLAAGRPERTTIVKELQRLYNARKQYRREKKLARYAPADE